MKVLSHFLEHSKLVKTKHCKIELETLACGWGVNKFEFHHCNHSQQWNIINMLGQV